MLGVLGETFTLEKAKTDIRGVATSEGVDFNEPGDKIICVDVFDTEGAKVFHADITMDVRGAA